MASGKDNSWSDGVLGTANFLYAFLIVGSLFVVIAQWAHHS